VRLDFYAFTSRYQNREMARRLSRPVFGINGRTLLHQKLDAWQVASKHSKMEQGTIVLYHTQATRGDEGK
jgi:hypothetical protein